MTRRNIGILVGVVVLVFISAAAWVLFGQPRSRGAVPAAQNAKSTNGAGQGVRASNELVFAKLRTPALPASAEDAKPGTVAYQEVAVTPANAPNLSVITAKYGFKLTETEKAFLQANKFVLVPLARTSLAMRDVPNFDEFINAFDRIGGSPYDVYREPQNARLVTPDVVLHAYHKFFENSLEDLEQNYLSQELEKFLTTYTEALHASRVSATLALAARYDRLLAQALVARVLLETHVDAKLPTDPDGVSQFTAADETSDTLASALQKLEVYKSWISPKALAQVQEEIRRVYEANGLYASELFGEYSTQNRADYTQYTPRSHYTKNSVLRSYFRSMMYLGRNSYFFATDAGITDSLLSILAFNAIGTDGSTARDYWQHIMEITGFYAGQSDDVTYNEMVQFVKDVLGTQTVQPEQALDETVIKKLSSQLSKLRLPKILSDVIVDPNIEQKNKNDLLRATLGFRLFGQRFTFDAWVLNQLTAGQEDPEHALPSMPSAIFIPAAFGSARATELSLRHLTETVGWPAEKTNYFQSVLAARKQDLAKVALADWYASLGTAWLYTIEPLTHTFGSGYPSYMQNKSFVDKSLITWLGSYTELKHDTVLYAKQSFAELGAGGPEGDKPPIVKGFVEPNIPFWKKLNALVDYNIALFNEYGLDDISRATFQLGEFKRDVAFFLAIAQKEMANQPITEEEYEKLRTINLGFMAVPIAVSLDATTETSKSALVTDVHTDALSGNILYEATGQPKLMIALVGNEQSPRATIGLVFNHYEFTGPLSKRLNDEEWKERVYAATPKLPPRNFWYENVAGD